MTNSRIDDRDRRCWNQMYNVHKIRIGIPNKMNTPIVPPAGCDDDADSCGSCSWFCCLWTKQSLRLMNTDTAHQSNMNRPKYSRLGNVYPTRTETVTMDDIGTNVSNNPKAATFVSADKVGVSSGAIALLTSKFCKLQLVLTNTPLLSYFSAFHLLLLILWTYLIVCL
jgi:hypothetical protein